MYKGLFSQVNCFDIREQIIVIIESFLKLRFGSVILLYWNIFWGYSFRVMTPLRRVYLKITLTWNFFFVLNMIIFQKITAQEALDQYIS